MKGLMTATMGALVLVATGVCQAQDAGSSSFVVAGDPQMHSLQGGMILQSTAMADGFVKVSRRNPEENLLAGYVFDYLVDQATGLPGGTSQDMLVLLGDGTNIACTGEFDHVNASLDAVRSKGRIALWAPGNHDSYLTGTTNQAFPSKAGNVGRADVLKRMAASPVPLDESWWTSPAEITPDNAWNNMCWNNGTSLPINKGQWIARYARSLGVGLEGHSDEPGIFRLTATVDPQSALGRQHFALLGRWYPPLNDDYTSDDAVKRPYLSYIVQAIDVGDRHRLILIDTSVCRDARLQTTNAGTHACIGEEQLKDIETLADTDRQLVFGGHFPLHLLSAADQRSLLSIFNKGGRRWSFLSAHTHNEARTFDHSSAGPYGLSADQPRYDFNVGSTTDWPMEAHRVVLDDSKQGLTLEKATLKGTPGTRYVASSLVPPRSFELCRHIHAAERLADIDLQQPLPARWNGGTRASEVVDALRCSRHTPEYAERMAKARAKIDARMHGPDGEAYRKRVFEIARAASLDSNEQFAVLSALEQIIR